MARRTMAAVNDRGCLIGEHHPHARLTQADVNRLLEMRAQAWSLGQLAKLFGVSKSCVQHICSGRAWTHKAARYLAVDAVARAPLVLDMAGVAPALGPLPAPIADADDEVDWPRPVAAPLPSLPALAAGQEAGERVLELAVWFLSGRKCNSTR